MSKTTEHWESILYLPVEAGRPRYLALADSLTTAIEGLEPDTPLPSENELVRLAGVSRATVRRALSELVRAGRLATRRGSGTFVAGRPLGAELNRLVGFSETAQAHGRLPGSVVVEARLVACEGEVAGAFGASSSVELVRIERVRLLDGRPAMLEQAHLPVRFRALLDEDLEGSLYAAMQKLSVQPLARGEERVFAVRAQRRIAYLLGVEVGASLLASVRRSWDADGRLTELTHRYVRPDRCAYVVTLVGGSSWTVLSDAEPWPELLESVGRLENP